MKKYLPILLAAVLLLPQITHASIGSGVVGYWNLDEASGNAADSSGNGFTLTNTGTVTYGAGLLNNAANFGNPNTTRKLARSSIITGGNITIHTWVKLNTAISSGSWGLFEQEDDNALRIFNVIYSWNGGTPQVVADYHKNNVTDNNINANFTLSTSVWHDIDVTYDGATYTLYIDCVPSGSLAISGGGSGVDNGNSFNLGSAPRYGIFGPIQIDDAIVYQRAISTSESCQLYNAGVGRTPFSIPSSVMNLMKGTASLMQGILTIM